MDLEEFRQHIHDSSLHPNKLFMNLMEEIVGFLHLGFVGFYDEEKIHSRNTILKVYTDLSENENEDDQQEQDDNIKCDKNIYEVTYFLIDCALDVCAQQKNPKYRDMFAILHTLHNEFRNAPISSINHRKDDVSNFYQRIKDFHFPQLEFYMARWKYESYLAGTIKNLSPHNLPQDYANIVYEYLKIKGEYCTYDDMKADIGIGATTISNALKVLRSRGLIETVKNKGTIVKQQ